MRRSFDEGYARITHSGISRLWNEDVCYTGDVTSVIQRFFENIHDWKRVHISIIHNDELDILEMKVDYNKMTLSFKK
jgi:hypothetical protein